MTTTLTALPTPPQRTDPANFPARGDAFLAALPAFVSQANALAGELNAALAQAQAVAADPNVNNAASLAASAAAQAGVATSQVALATTQAQNALASAALAAAHAASAASVVAQDLSGITAQALHRSPNAVTALLVIDTSADPDPAWPERCEAASWYTEAINGAWRGACATEAACRAISGATTGDYFQLTTDGKCYKLNAVSGVTEVFRGNKRKFPALVAAVAESSSVTLYDLTEPGRPMWMRFAQGGGNWSAANVLYPSAMAINSLAWASAVLVVGAGATGDGGCTTIDFAADTVIKRIASTSYGGIYGGGIGRRQGGAGYANANAHGYTALVNGNVNKVAATVLPGAPLHPVSRLPVPTVGVATAGGFTVLRHDGVAALSTAGGIGITRNIGDASFDSLGHFVFEIGENSKNYRKCLAPLYSAYVTYYASPFSPGAAAITTSSGAINRHTGKRLALAARNLAAGYGAWLIRDNDSALNGAGLGPVTAALVQATGVSGCMFGDIRRALLADATVGAGAGSVTGGTELISNGDFASGVSGWSVYAGALSSVSGRLRLTADGSQGASQSRAYQIISTVPGRAYRVVADVTAGTAAASLGCGDGSISAIANVVSGVSGLAAGVSGSFNASFVALGSSSYILFLGAATAGQYVDFDNISVQEVIADRCYKAKPAAILGTLTKTAVATGAELLAYSGFSAANYAQEAYSADLDFGTGPWTVSAWASIPVGVSAAATLVHRAASGGGASLELSHTATGQITITAFDGTTTRTATTSGSYATGAFIKVRGTYTTDGKLAVQVNGREMASATGSPLLTLNNASATLTLGNSVVLDKPFTAGSLAMVKLSASTPTTEQAAWMYAQESAMFAAGAVVTLPAASTIADLGFDADRDVWLVAQSGYLSEWNGLVRTAASAPSAGSFSKAAAGAGVTLMARTSSSPGADITLPALGLRTELARRRNGSAPKQRQVFDFDAATSQVDFALPVGWVAIEIMSAGASKREGSTKDYTRLFDGFVETIRFAVAPGNAVWVQIVAERG